MFKKFVLILFFLLLPCLFLLPSHGTAKHEFTKIETIKFRLSDPDTLVDAVMFNQQIIWVPNDRMIVNLKPDIDLDKMIFDVISVIYCEGQYRETPELEE